MICEKCGKSNIKEMEKCVYCGEKIPAKKACGGFADILKFEDSHRLAIKQESNTEDLRRLEERYNRLVKLCKKNQIFSFIAITLSILILTSSIIQIKVMNKDISAYKKENSSNTEIIKKEIEETKQQLGEISEEIDKHSKMISEIKQTNENTEE